MIKGDIKMSKGYFELYSKLVDDYKKHNKYNKQRLIKKHCNMATEQALKRYPNMRPFYRGRKVYTYKIYDHVFFTATPKQKECSCYTDREYKIVHSLSD